MIIDAYVDRFPGIAAIDALGYAAISGGVNRSRCLRVNHQLGDAGGEAVIARFPSLAAIARAVDHSHRGMRLERVLRREIR